MKPTEMKIASKEQVWHLVKRGMLMQLHFDFETFGLDRGFAQIMSYGDALGDIAGNMINSEEIQVKRPDRYLASPAALEVTRTTDPAELDDASRTPHPIAMGKIAQRFEEGPHMLGKLPLKAVEVSFETVRKAGPILTKKPYTETILEYPLKDADGNIVNDVRYHPDRKLIAYRVTEADNVDNNYYIDSDGSQWKFVQPRLEVSGFRIQAADMGWMRENLVKAGYHPSNIFFTHSRSNITNKQKPKNFAVDAYNLAMAVHAFGPQDETGLKLGKRIDNRTGQEVVSATLSRIMEANTRYESAQRGIREGIRMPDNMLYEEPRAHRSPAYDAQASFALANYCRELAPDIVRDLENQADEKQLRHDIPGTDPEIPPIFAMVRNSYPITYPLADPVTCLGFDDQLGKMGKAIMMRLDIDLRHFSYDGKAAADMTPQDFVRLIEDKNRKVDFLIRLVPIRRWGGAVKLEDAMNAGMGSGDPDFYDRIDDSFRFLVENPSVVEAIRGATEIINNKSSHRADSPNALMEEQWTHNGFGNLDYLEHAAEKEKLRREGTKAPGNRGEPPALVETLYNKAQWIYEYHNGMDELLHRLALQPHPIEWSDSPEALDNFRDLLQRAKNKFNKKDSPYKWMLDNNVQLSKITLEQARAFRWRLAKRLLADDEKEKQAPESQYAKGYFEHKDSTHGRILFGDLSRNYRVLDQQGRHLTLEYLQQQHARDPHTVQKNIEKGIWRIQFYRLSSEPSITANLYRFADMGKLSELPASQQEQYIKLRKLLLRGPSDSDASDHNRPTTERIERELKKMEVNARQGKHQPIARIFSSYAKGEAEIFMTKDESQRLINKYRTYLDEIKKENQLTPEFWRSVNYDPATGAKYDWVEHEIDAGNIVTVDVPDPHLRDPLMDIRMAPYALVVSKIPAEVKAQIRHGATLLLRGQQTGQLYYPGPVDILKSPPRDQGYQDFLDQAQKSYEQDAGVDFPKAGQREVLITGKLEPVAGSRPKLDPSIQSVKVPTLFFTGLVAPRLAHFAQDKPFTGLVLPVDYVTQKLDAGQPIRFREMDVAMGAKLTGEEENDTGHIYESKSLNSVRRVKVADLRATVSNEDAQHCGFASAYDMWEKVQSSFLNQESTNVDNEEVYLLDFAKVKKESWAFWNPAETPTAALVRDGRHVSPSAYRDFPGNDNNTPQAPKRNGTGPAP